MFITFISLAATSSRYGINVRRLPITFGRAQGPPFVVKHQTRLLAVATGCHGESTVWDEDVASAQPEIPCGCVNKAHQFL
jgi:hypothetical protein